MRLLSLPTIYANVARLGTIVPLLCVLLFGCSEEERLPNYRLAPPNATTEQIHRCAVPAEGCSCDEPGKLLDCGEVSVRIDDYVTCTEGVRTCLDDNTWGPCVGDLVKKRVSASTGKRPEALGVAEGCSDINPCDPLCRQIVDTGTALDGLPEGLCSTASGLAPCPVCGYSGPVAELPNAEMPADWQIVPEACASDGNDCPFDLDCVASTCRMRTAPCASTNLACDVDLTLGKPCFDLTSPETTYHIAVCNRGAGSLTGGTIRIGVDSRSATATTCMPQVTPGFPDSGTVSYTLAPGERIESGACIDVNPGNSVASGLNFSDNRALLVNYDGSVSECNACNNGSAAIVNSEVGRLSICPDCVNLQCSQTDPSTTLRGVVYDPAGRRPLPNVVVYVPNDPVLPFVDGVGCDTCESVISGSPITWTTTDATGHFELTNVPSETFFPLVTQLGRWRREFRVQEIPSGQAAWVSRNSRTFGYVVVTLGTTEPEPWVNLFSRLRLPATQRRCSGSECVGEGDIPRMAVMMGDADPVQCVLRRIGIADSEFTASTEDGRIHLFHASGMKHAGAWGAYGAGGLVTDEHQDGAPALWGYSVLLAPCDTARDKIGGGQANYAQSAYASGPSLNGWPDSIVTDGERDDIRAFLESGGRLLTTHWESVDLVHRLFSDAPHNRFSPENNSIPLISPYDADADADFAGAIAAYASDTAPGFAWANAASLEYDPQAPVVYLFGNGVEAGSNTIHGPIDALNATYPRLAYSVDTTNPLGLTFSQWADHVGATTAPGSEQLWWTQWSPIVVAARSELGVTPLLASDSTQAARFDLSDASTSTRAVPLAQRPCLQGQSGSYACGPDNGWGDAHVGMLQFDTPIDSSQKCGRVAVASGHVSTPRCFAPSGIRAQKYCDHQPPFDETNPAPDCDCLEFPADGDLACGAASDSMGPEELAFEFLLFSANQCVGDLHPLPPTVPMVREFVRDFEADCTQGEHPRWQLFSWQATVPTNTRIDFYGATADTQEELDQAQFAVIGLAEQSTTTWTASNRTIDNAIRQDIVPPDTSRRWLRVAAEFWPNGANVPALQEWRVVFNCVPSE